MEDYELRILQALAAVADVAATAAAVVVEGSSVVAAAAAGAVQFAGTARPD